MHSISYGKSMYFTILRILCQVVPLNKTYADILGIKYRYGHIFPDLYLIFRERKTTAQHLGIFGQKLTKICSASEQVATFLQKLASPRQQLLCMASGNRSQKICKQQHPKMRGQAPNLNLLKPFLGSFFKMVGMDPARWGCQLVKWGIG